MLLFFLNYFFKVGTVTPIEDFKALLSRTDCDMFEKGKLIVLI